MVIKVDSYTTVSGFRNSKIKCPEKKEYIHIGRCENCKYCVSINSVHMECSIDWDEPSTKVLTDVDGNEYTINRYKFNKYVKDCLTKEV